MTSKLSPRIALIIIAGLFVLPLALAWLMYSGAIDFQPAETRNLGALVEPPVPAALESLDMVDHIDRGPRALLVSVTDGAAAVSPIAVALDAAGVSVEELTLRTPTLDDVFLTLTGRSLID